MQVPLYSLQVLFITCPHAQKPKGPYYHQNHFFILTYKQCINIIQMMYNPAFPLGQVARYFLSDMADILKL